MPSDPTFETREKLEKWRRNAWRRYQYNAERSFRLKCAEIQRQIVRVTLAHAHLLEDRNDD